MYPASALNALGFDDLSIARARASAHVVGRGEGFVSREWRAPDGRVLALHFDEAGVALACVLPFVAGLGWQTWTLEGVQESEVSPHLSTARVRAGGVALAAVLPDFAARRHLFPVGLEVKASVVVAVEAWRGPAASDGFVEPIEGESTGAVRVCGRIVEVAPLGPCVKVAVEREGVRVWLCGPPDPALQAGADVAAAGRALVRIGAPLTRRGPLV